MLDMNALLAAKKIERADCVASDGSVQKTPESKDFRNALIKWHDDGKPSGERADLKSWEKKLRSEGKF